MTFLSKKKKNANEYFSIYFKICQTNYFSGSYFIIHALKGSFLRVATKYGLSDTVICIFMCKIGSVPL